MKTAHLKTSPEWQEQSFNYLGPDGCNHDSPSMYFRSELGLCGCCSDGIVDMAISLMKKLYEAKLNDDSYYYEYKDKTELEQNFQEVILHILDDKELTEHGSSVRGSWLTDKGVKMCRELFDVREG